MKCNNCGVERKNTYKFCKECGTSFEAIENVEIAATAEPSAVIENPSIQTDQENSSPSKNKDEAKEYVEKIKEHSASYIAFLIQAIKAPSVTARQIAGTKMNMIMGIVTLFFIALFIPIISNMNVKTTTRGFVDTPIGEIFIFNIALAAVTIGVLYLIGKFAKSNGTIQDIVAKYGALMSISLTLLLLSFIFALLKMVTLSLGMLAISFVATVVAIIHIVHLLVKEAKSGIDSIYASLITLVVLAIVIYAFGEKVINNVNPLNMFW